MFPEDSIYIVMDAKNIYCTYFYLLNYTYWIYKIGWLVDVAIILSPI